MKCLNSLRFWDANRSPILARRPDPGLINKKRTDYHVDFAIPVDYCMKIKESEKDCQVLGSCQRTKRAVEYESDGYINCSWYTWNSPKRLEKMTWGIGNQRKNQNHPDHGIVKIG